MAASPISTCSPIYSHSIKTTSFLSRSSKLSIVSVLSNSSGNYSSYAGSSKVNGFRLKLDQPNLLSTSQRSKMRMDSTGSIVALGKFDALHVGHRELAIQASKAGTPFLLSFVGIAEVLGWAPRPPIVAKCDRDRVLSSWAPLCGSIAPKEYMIDFSLVRHLTPRLFVEKLAKELGVHGVVAGENYRFGYKAAGDASELARLCDEYGMKAFIIKSVMDQNKDEDNSYPQDKKDIGQVSSTRVRYALGKGDMNYVSKLLGRQHRLIFSADCCKQYLDGSKIQFSGPRSSLLNLPPKDGLYENCSLIVGGESQLPCQLLIDSTHIYLESDVKDNNIHDAIKGAQLLGVEFRG